MTSPTIRMRQGTGRPRHLLGSAHTPPLEQRAQRLSRQPADVVRLDVGRPRRRRTATTSGNWRNDGCLGDPAAGPNTGRNGADDFASPTRQELLPGTTRFTPLFDPDSPSRSSPWSTNTNSSWSPTARCTSAATDESTTPPDSATARHRPALRPARPSASSRPRGRRRARGSSPGPAAEGQRIAGATAPRTARCPRTTVRRDVGGHRRVGHGVAIDTDCSGLAVEQRHDRSDISRTLVPVRDRAPRRAPGPSPNPSTSRTPNTGRKQRGVESRRARRIHAGRSAGEDHRRLALQRDRKGVRDDLAVDLGLTDRRAISCAYWAP